MNETNQELRVEQSNELQPFGESSSPVNVQQTRGSEALGVQNDGETMSAAETQEVLNFLRSEAAGPQSQSNAASDTGISAPAALLILLAAIIAVALLMVYHRFYKKLLAR